LSAALGEKIFGILKIVEASISVIYFISDLQYSINRTKFNLA